MLKSSVEHARDYASRLIDGVYEEMPRVDCRDLILDVSRMGASPHKIINIGAALISKQVQDFTREYEAGMCVFSDDPGIFIAANGDLGRVIRNLIEDVKSNSSNW